MNLFNVLDGKKLWGLLEYKPQWTLSLQGWLLLLVLLGTSFILWITQIHSFLAPKAPIPEAETLLIEGWIGDSAIVEAVNEFKQGNYSRIIVTGTQLYRGSFLSEYKTYADLTTATLKKLGVVPEKIVTLPTPYTKRDRTAAAAVIVKRWIEESDPELKTLNVYSSDVHTRRSWWIYQKVLGKEIKVGAIAYRNLDYDPYQWWSSSVGFRSVTEEGLAYFYARFFWYKKN